MIVEPPVDLFRTVLYHNIFVFYRLFYVPKLLFQTFWQVHLKHLDGHIEEVYNIPLFYFVHVFLKDSTLFSLKIYPVQVPYFCLPANDLVDVIAPSCYR